MKVLSFGAGAIGTYIGGSLALCGHSVTFLERPEAAEILHLNGITLSRGNQTNHIQFPHVVSNLAEALANNSYDVALFALKAFDTKDAVQELAQFTNQIPPILCLQNGVENETILAEVLGKDKVIPGTVTSAVGRVDVGNIYLERLRGVGIAGEHPFTHQLIQALNEAGLNARYYARGSDMKWSKMITNLLANATSAILNMTPSEIYAHSGLFELEKAQILEALAVMKKKQIQVVDLPGTPVRALVFAIQNLPGNLSRLVLKRGVGGGRGGKMPSFHIDLHNQRPKSEVEYLNGAVVRLGAKLNLQTPANRVLTDTLMAMTNKKISVSSYDHQPERLLSLYKNQT
jgi:2-dehydropantoate 2-reductase